MVRPPQRQRGSPGRTGGCSGWQLGNGTTPHSSVIFGDSFYQLNLHSPFFPPSPQKCCRGKTDVGADHPKPAPAARPRAGGGRRLLFGRHRGLEGDEGCSLGGVGGQLNPAHAVEVRLHLQGQHKSRAGFVLLPLTRSDLK